MGYRWKPNKAQKEAYKEKLKEKDNLNFIHSKGPIRKGCFVKYYNLNKGIVISGTVTNSSYGKDKGQHTFTIDSVKVKGRNIYPNLIEHIPGEISIKETK